MFIKTNKKYLDFLFLYLINFNNFSFNNFLNNNLEDAKNWVYEHKFATSLICFSIDLVLHKVFFVDSLRPYKFTNKTATHSGSGERVVKKTVYKLGSRDEIIDYKYSLERAVQCEHGVKATKTGNYCDQCKLRIIFPKVIVGWGGSSIVNQERRRLVNQFLSLIYKG